MLEHNEPSPFEVINADGTAPLLIACDHAENGIPRSLAELGLKPKYKKRHIAYDIGAKQVAIMLSEIFDAPLLLAGYSRLVIDLNRQLNDPTLIVSHSDNVDIPGNQGLTECQRNQRIEIFFDAYHDRYTEMVDVMVNRHKRPIILSVHSFARRVNGIERPWEYGILWDMQEKIAKRMIENLSKVSDYPVGDNQPYHAKDPQGYSQLVHAQQRQVEMALLEIRQDFIAEPRGQRKAAKTVAEAIQPLLS